MFECFVLSELQKQSVNNGERPRVSFWRDTAGHEVDFLIDLGNRRVAVEAKAGQTIASDWFRGLEHYGALAGDIVRILLYGGDAFQTRAANVIYPWWACS